MAPKSLPRDLDVQISLSMAQTELATDMTLACLLSPDLDWLPSARLRFYSTFEAFAEDIDDSKSIYHAGVAFFAQANRPATLAVGRVFTTNLTQTKTAATLTSDTVTVGEALKAITTGTLTYTCGTAQTILSDLDFHSCTDLASVAAVLGTGWAAVGDALVCTSASTGANQLAVLPATGTLAGLLALDAVSGGVAVAGTTTGENYTYVDFAAEIAATQTAAIATGRKVYCWLLDASYRDTGTEQADLAEYCLAARGQFCVLCTNDDTTALDADDEANIGSVVHLSGNSAASVFYHDNAQQYPDVAYAAIAIGVNFSLPDSALTLKFKDLTGIDTVQLTETQLSALEARNINTFTAIGNSSRTVRQGTQAAENWYTDTKVGLDNFVEELQVEVYNVFLRRPKVPYTRAGQMLLVAAAEKIGKKYTRNGVFADRQIEDSTEEAGFRIEPAVTITPEPIYTATTSMRAARLAPPIAILAYLAGAIHKVAIAIEVVQ